MANEENPSDPITFNAGFKGLVPFYCLIGLQDLDSVYKSDSFVIQGFIYQIYGVLSQKKK
jgi:hypothetical protein